ncbi:MAG: [FeFe] hydrogenase H-cluster maturation GTPase HydF [Fretibacterium sp.]|nr:[FeFe] hydrogenase H-cluster maturation GTPase HydF [Fretibacterium sp.]
MTGLNDIPSGERVHIGFFGVRNAGKSRLVNAVTGQNLSVVSNVPGTTTDPVRKAMEILPLGPVVIIDTPGLDDEGALGEQRVERARRVLAECDAAVLVLNAVAGPSDFDRSLLALFEERKLPYLTAHNKADLLEKRPPLKESGHGLYTSALTGEGVPELKERLAALLKAQEKPRHLVADLLSPGDTVLLVVPVDESAPRGRLILPQQQTIRDILDAHGSAVICQDTELKGTLSRLAEKPRLVVTDSQAFEQVARDVPADIPLTSFSILFARYKGELSALARGAEKLAQLRDGDRVLISEGCTHHRQCGDIGTVKMPAWIRKYSGAEPDFFFTSGGDFPADLTEYALVVHCGGCMLNEREMKARLARAEACGTPAVNYGMAIAQMHGILQRSLEPLL